MMYSCCIVLLLLMWRLKIMLTGTVLPKTGRLLALAVTYVANGPQ